MSDIHRKEPVQIKGRWYVTLYGENGIVEREGDNVITTNALDFLANFLNSAAAAASTFSMRYVAIGSDSTSESAANTTLGVELARTTGTVSYSSSAIYRVTATFPSGTGTGAIVEYGLFSSSTGGTMFNRDVESVINKGANDVLVVTTEVTFS